MNWRKRIGSEVGIFWRFEMDRRLEQDVVILQDSPEQYQFGVTLPLIPVSRTSDNGQLSVWDIKTRQQVVPASVATRDYNYRQALTPQDSSASVSRTEGITTGEIYHYAEPFLSEGSADTPESGSYYARLRHERILNAQQAVVGKTTSPELVPGEVLEPQGSLPANLKEGIVIAGVQSSGSRKKSFQMTFSGIPYSEAVCWRPPLLNRPLVAGTLPARVESIGKGDTYAWLDNQGRYRTRLDFDRSDSEQGYAYLWLRMAKPYAGDNHGFHAPLLTGDGPLFKGRGLLQITGRDNYTKCQTYLRKKLNDEIFDITSSVSKAKQLSENPKYAALASGYFWRYIKPKLNVTADKDDVYWVSVYVNGWAVQVHPYYPDKTREPNHMDDRINKLSIAKDVFGME